MGQFTRLSTKNLFWLRKAPILSDRRIAMKTQRKTDVQKKPIAIGVSIEGIYFWNGIKYSIEYIVEHLGRSFGSWPARPGIRAKQDKH